MKKSKLLGIISLILLCAFSFSSCNIAAPEFNGGDISDGFASMKGESMSPGASYDSSDSESGEDVEGSDKIPETDQVVRPSGLITASAWNDNDNYELYRKLFEQWVNEQGTDEYGKFYHKPEWNFNTYNRIKLTVKAGDKTVAGAEVVAESTGGNTYRAVTDANGVAYLFTEKTEGEITVTSADYTSKIQYLQDTTELEVELEGAAEKKNKIELMFVIDVTGSMGDELRYLQDEIYDVISRVYANDNSTEISLALLFYRDLDDKEQFKYYDFVNVSAGNGINGVVAALDSQKATGGGDYPEAVDDALEHAVNAQWSSGETTKLIFHILDAPPHSKEENKTKFNKAVKDAAAKGIRICPIICSGTDSLTEYLMREAAVMTAGTFVFITDDSGIGGAHHDPDIPSATVEALNSLMVRLINGYHSGEFADPVDWRQEIK